LGTSTSGGAAGSGGTAITGPVNTGGSAGKGSGGAGGSSSTGGNTGTGGSAGKGSAGAGGSGGSSPVSLPPDPCVAANTCPTGTWVNVTPPTLAPLDFGNGAIVVDPLRPSDLYMGGGGDGLWKSIDYGNKWSKISATIGYVASGVAIAVLPGTPAIVLGAGFKVNHKSTDGGVTFNDIPVDLPDVLYSIQVDPYDPTHLLSGLHETGGIVESTDAGDSWHYVKTGGFPNGGSSWYAFFLDTGNAATTRNTWLAIPQAGGSTTLTTNGGTSWAIPSGVSGLTHAHGNAQLFQQGNTIFLPGIDGPGNVLYKSTDEGQHFSKVLDGTYSVAWGTQKNLYMMWGWACSKCDLGAAFTVAPLPAASPFTKPAVPADLKIGPRNMAVTSDGKHNIFVGTMWAAGVWRYVEG